MSGGRAGWPPTSEARRRRQRALGLARDAATPSRAYAAAEELVATAEAEAKALTEDRNEAETEELRTRWARAAPARAPRATLRGATGAIKDLEGARSRARRGRRGTRSTGR